MTPFEIDPTQIAQLNNQFGVFISHLLETEQSAQGIAGHKLNFNKNETTPDGGVDAAIADAKETSWLPGGNSAWQFKQSNPAAEACKEEIEKSTWAHDYLKNGGHYIMVQGKQLTDQAIKNRHKALCEKAVELGLIDDTDADKARIRVYDANLLAKWASEYPALTLDPILQISLGHMQSYDRWTESRRHQGKWVPDEHRTQIVQELTDSLKKPEGFEFRIEGPSGIGKTRMVMEAFRDDEIKSLVAYGPEAAKITPDALNYLVAKKRRGILIIDECGRRTHEKLAEQLSVNADLRLITIGQADTELMSVRMYAPGPMPPAEVEKALEKNEPTLWVEARSFVSENCAGNMKLAYILAARLKEKGAGQAAELMQRGDLETILSIVLPEDQDFLLMAGIALFERIGWDDELSPELDALADFLGHPVTDLKRVALKLERQGLLEKQGRYRAVVPNPVAVYLAAKFWSAEGQRIVKELLPKIGKPMAAALFARVADLGRYEPASSVLEELLSSDEFSSLQSIQANGLSEFLIKLAIVTPDRTMEHLGKLISNTDLDSLREMSGIRRDLVWTLQKLAWHTRTFYDASKALQRLALAENESYGNNASGVWKELFGAMLPATAASPEQRTNYLSELLDDENPKTRLMLVHACEAGLSHHESVAVSAELQGGASVEPRGRAKTWGEVREYGKKLIDFLGKLVDDPDEGVSKEAIKALTDQLHPIMFKSIYGDDIRAALSKFGQTHSQDMLKKINETRVWVNRVDNKEFTAILDEMEKKLPAIEPFAQLKSLAELTPWDFDEQPLRERLDTVLSSVVEDDSLSVVIEWLRDNAVQAAWMVGRAIAETQGTTDKILEELSVVAETNPAVIAGFLNVKVVAGDKAAFDSYVDGALGKEHSNITRIFLTTRGPATAQAKKRAIQLVSDLQPKEAAGRLFSWGRDFNTDELNNLIQHWAAKIEDQEDYNAVIDWLNLWLHSRDFPDEIDVTVWQLLQLREKFPDVGQQKWDWSELAKRFIGRKSIELTDLLFRMVVKKDFMLAHSDEGQLITECAKDNPSGVWEIVAPYLEQREWRVLIDLQGWFVHSLPLETITTWIGDSIERARVVASVADPGDEKPTELGRYLLVKFPDDKKIIQSLNAQYWNDGWSGSWASHLEKQISQLQQWVDDASEETAVRNWAKQMIQNLRSQQKGAIQEEEEKHW